MAQPSDLIERAKAFLAALERGAPWEEVAAFYAPDVIQTEHPNQLVPKGAVRDLAALKVGAESGRRVMTKHTYEVTSATVTGNLVAIEAVWTGTLAIPFGKLRPGDTMRARFAQFFEFRDGLIWRQRNYDCFEPW